MSTDRIDRADLRGAGGRVSGRALAGLLLAGLTARAGWLAFAGIPGQEGGDATHYITLATHVAQGLGFTTDGISPTTYRPPLFSWLLGGWCRLLGSTSLRTMAAYQVLLQSLAAPLAYLLARLLRIPPGLAILGGLVLAADPFLVSTVGLILQEPTQTVFGTLAAIAVAAWAGRRSAWRAALAGALFGVAALAKSPYLLLGPSVLLVSRFGREARQSWPLLHVALAGLMTAAVVTPWTWRNWRVTGGHFVPINTQDVTLPIWLVADGYFEPRLEMNDAPQSGGAPVTGVLLTYGNPEGVRHLREANDALLARGLSGDEVVRALSRVARAYLLRHPWYVLEKTARGAVLLCSPDASILWTGSIAARLAGMLLFHVPLALAFVAGTVRALKGREPEFLCLAAFTVVYLMMHAPVAIAGGRYAVPVLPLMIAVAARPFAERRPHPAADRASAQG